MINNDVLRSVRHLLKVSEIKLIEIIKLGGGDVGPDQISSYLKKDEEAGFIECPQQVMIQFLNGLIYFKRGKDESRPPLENEIPTNNVVLKKLRVAFQLKDEDIIQMLTKVNFDISKAELSAFFRKENHPNFRICGDQFLRNFLKALTLKIRGPSIES